MQLQLAVHYLRNRSQKINIEDVKKKKIIIYKGSPLVT